MRLLDLLKRIEWNQGNSMMLCPGCGSIGPRHSQTCELEAAIDALQAAQDLHGDEAQVRPKAALVICRGCDYRIDVTDHLAIGVELAGCRNCGTANKVPK